MDLNRLIKKVDGIEVVVARVSVRKGQTDNDNGVASSLV